MQFFFEKQRIFDCAFGLFACVSVHSNDLQPLLFQCASHRCATPVVNGSWLILDGITAVLMGLLRGLVENLFKGFWESKYDAWM